MIRLKLIRSGYRMSLARRSSSVVTDVSVSRLFVAKWFRTTSTVEHFGAITKCTLRHNMKQLVFGRQYCRVDV